MKTWIAAAVILLMAGAVRLPGLAYPSQVVFDEVHFGKFVTAYCCTGQRFFDIHPPHAKLLIAGTAKLLEYLPFDSAQGKVFDFNHIGQPYGRVNVLALRIFPALMGVLLPLIFLGVLRQLGVSWQIALLGGAAVALDNALIVQSRLIALDGVLLVATFGALAAFLYAGRKPGWLAVIFYALAGVLAGLAAGTKFTGLAALGILGVVTAVKLVQSRRAIWAARGFVILALAVVIYAAGWWLHFALLSKAGPGDAWGVPTGNFWQDTVKLHKTMLSANYSLTATHPDESRAWTWPLMLTGIFYWSAPGGEVIYFLGNPVVWWGSTVVFLVALADALRKKFSMTKAQFPKLWIPLVGFLISYVPLLRVPRALFLYHYLTPLLFALTFGLVWLDMQVNLRHGAGKVLLATAAVILVFFVLFSPMTYGLDVPPTWRQVLYWLPGWR